MTTITLRDEIIDILKDVYFNNDQVDPFDDGDADRILQLIRNRIDEIRFTCNNDYETETCERIKRMLKQ